MKKIYALNFEGLIIFVGKNKENNELKKKNEKAMKGLQKDIDLFFYIKYLKNEKN